MLDVAAKLTILADAAKYDASCASQRLRPQSLRRRHGQHHRHRHLPQLHARRPLRLAAQNSLHQLLRLRLRLLRQPHFERHAARPLHRRRSDQSHSRFLPPQLHRRPLPLERHHSESRLHDGAAHRRRARPASRTQIRRLHPFEGDAQRVARTHPRSRPVGRPP